MLQLRLLRDLVEAATEKECLHCDKQWSLPEENPSGRSLVFGSMGPNNIEITSDDSGSSTERVALSNRKPATEFKFEFPGYERYCITKNGRGLHHRTAHKAWYDEYILDACQSVRPVWSAEKSAMLAKREVELIFQGVRYINIKLKETFSHRTVDAIKGQRRSQKH